jgi:hypothetical protein
MKTGGELGYLPKISLLKDLAVGAEGVHDGRQDAGATCPVFIPTTSMIAD